MRGKLRIYLGPAPGVGKTYAMLDEGWRRRQRGADVVIGIAVCHDRPNTIAQIRDLEIVPPRRVEYRGRTWEEVDVDAILARRPQVVLVDELAHSNVSGSANEKRWQDIERLLAAGIEVLSTVNIQHLESLNDVVNRITGIVQRETVPDAVVRRADQIELVDMSPEALQRRMAHGNIYPADRVDAALANYFRAGNLGALRELALLWVADRVEDSVQAYMAQHGITAPWETRERVLVALTGAPGGDHLIRRAARMARRSQGDLVGVHIVSDDGLTRPEPEHLARHRALLEELGGVYHEVAGSDVPATLVGFAEAQHATQLVLGTSRRTRWMEVTRGSIINRVVRDAKTIDVHVISTEGATLGAQPPLRRVPIHSAQPRSRVVTAYAVAAVGLIAIGAFAAARSSLQPHHPGNVTASAGLLIFLGVILVVATIGGRGPALLTSLAAIAVVDWYLIPPYGSFAVARGNDAAYLVAFVVCAVAISIVIEQATRRRVEAVLARDEADAVMALAERLSRPNPPQVVVDEIHETLRRDAVALLKPRDEGWAVEAATGEPALTSPDAGERYDLRDGHVLVMSGRPLSPDGHRMVAALTSYLEAVMEINRLEREASAMSALSKANDLRSALLAAVSHDLRTPLASIKALASGWLEPDVQWSYGETHEFMTGIDADTDRLNTLVENLLDMSRLQSGALNLELRPVGLDEVVPAALASLSERASAVVVSVPESLPRVVVDAKLLERAIANVVDNAVRHSPADRPVRVAAAVVAGRMDLRVSDRGRGVPVAQREQLFVPFQRLGDTNTGTGVGLGLAVSKGFVEAIGGELYLEDTPGGGVTMVFNLPIEPTGRASDEPVLVTSERES
ncbi:MAG TPA: ATP-binding protein [Acidimicrobiia bacterium]|nr:ATP-binding protein [Acidimicrobiia bacterium]